VVWASFSRDKSPQLVFTVIGRPPRNSPLAKRLAWLKERTAVQRNGFKPQAADIRWGVIKRAYFQAQRLRKIDPSFADRCDEMLASRLFLRTRMAEGMDQDAAFAALVGATAEQRAAILEEYPEKLERKN
jgi:hypothetical protein